MRFDRRRRVTTRGLVHVTIVAFVMLASVTRSHGQPLTFARYTAEHGLAASWIYGLDQDATGYLWVASGGGLQRFDGFQFTFLDPRGDPDGRLHGRPVLAVHVDRAGIVWAGTYLSGLVRVDPDSETTRFFGKVEGDPTSLSSNAVTSITPGRENHLWVSTTDGFHRFDPEAGTFRRYGDPRAPIVLQTIEDRRGTVWAGTTLGLLRLNAGSDKPELITSAPYLASPYIRRIYEDQAGRLWFGTNRGIGSYDPVSGASRLHVLKPVSGPGSSVLDICEDPAGRLWVSTHGGIFALDAQGHVREVLRNEVTDPSSLSSNDGSAMLVDRSGVLWVGTQTGWLNRAELAKARFLRLSSFPRTPWSLNHPDIVDVAAGSAGRVWLASSGGLQSFDPATMRMRTIDVPLATDPNVRPAGLTSVFEDLRGTVWVGTTHGALLRRQGDRFATFFLPHPPGRTGLRDAVSAIAEDRTGTLWIGTAMGGVRSFDRRRETWGPYLIEPWPTQNYVKGLLRDRQGRLWVATSQEGVARIEGDGSVTRLVRDSSWLPDDQVGDIAEDPEGRIWLATVKGLVRYDPESDSARVFTTVDDRYRTCIIFSLVQAGDGSWWAGTSGGLVRFDPVDESFRHFRRADGVQGEEFTSGAAVRLSGGHLVFGGTSGATVVDPARLNDNQVRPSVVITGVALGDSVLAPVGVVVRQGLQLPFGELVLRVTVASLDYRSPESNRFRYRIDGLSEQWHAVEGRSIMITHLDPGHYTVRVRGTNNDGVEGQREATMAIEVLPPWWQRWWFRLGVVLSLVIGVLLVIRIRVGAIVREERLRSKIARDLHDDVSSTLSSILVFAEAVRSDRRRDAGRRRHYLDLITESARSARDMIGDIIWSVDPQHDDWPSFLSKCERSAADLFESAGIAYDLRITKDVSLDLDLVLRRNLWLIFKEIVANLVRHARASRAQVVIAWDHAGLLMMISDDGRGFDRSRVRRGNGLSNIERRAKEIGAEVKLESRPGGGTSWTLRLRKNA